MRTFRFAGITVVLISLVFVTHQTLVSKKNEILDSLALSVMASLVEIQTAGIQTAESEAAPDRILVAEDAEIARARQPRETLAVQVVALPPLRPLPKPFCTARPPALLASARAGEARYRYDLFPGSRVSTEVLVVTKDSPQTGDWAKLIASCREKSLKVCIEKSENRQRVVVLDSQQRDAISAAVAGIEQPVS